MVDPHLNRRLFSTAALTNGSAEAAAHPSSSEPSITSSGIIPGAIAAALFIILLLSLYGVLWKCMESPPTTHRKKRRLRVRVQPHTPV